MSELHPAREAINALFNAAGIQYRYRGALNDDVAAVYWQIVQEIQRCSSALRWVPRPTGRPNLQWLTRHFGKQAVTSIKSEESSITCAKVRLLQYRTSLEAAGLGL